MTRLGDILARIGLGPGDVPEGVAERDVSQVTADSREVRPGALFFAVSGTRADGMAYAAQAVDKGAVAVVGPSAGEVGPAPFIRVADVRAALAQAAAALYPRQPATIVAVTGTSGKTSVAAFTRQIWARLGLPAAALGTTGVVGPAGSAYGSLTTPDPVTLHRIVDELAGQGVDHLALEASSHGLDQRRLDGLKLTAGGFTNLSRDHLDYHPDLESYLAAKLRLFDTLLAPGAPAVINADSDVADRVAAAARTRGLTPFTVGRRGADLGLASVSADAEAQHVRLRHGGREVSLRIPLAGAFMVSNALVAAGLCIATGSPPAEVLAALEHLGGAPGRLERVGERRGAPVFVDYAHKPDALEKVLDALRPMATRRLIVVFGCGGDRDQGKRPLMGEIAARLADVVIVTDDNPRSEDPAAIRAAILAAAPGAREIGDRGSAIAQAIAMLEAGDVLVIAGKGHETGQTIAGRTLPFSDHEAARAALKEPAA